MAVAESFLDTNVFIYQLEGKDRRKFEIADRLIRSAVATGDACISSQVVQECLSAALRKAQIPLDLAGARSYLEVVLAPLCRVQSSLALYRRALDLQARYSISFYDSLIVAAGLEAGCKRLWTEDLQDGLKIDGLVVTNPFRARSAP